MEAAQEEAILRSKENNTHVLIKGKRTKRQRPQSPIPFPTVMTANSTSHVDADGEGCCGGGGGRGGGGFDGGDQSNEIANDNMRSFSPATSAEILQDSTEEEEDMANCLILLAQGQSRPESPKQVEEYHGDGGGGTVYKFNSRRFLEAAAAGTGKAGYYVYECKTCNRTFPSFQALGGHRASHKKPKAAMSAAEEKSSKQLLMLSSDEEEAQFMKKNDYLSSLSFQSSSRGLCGNNRSNMKVHECSICGAEFTSGQALGGHMRRHRAPIIGNKSNTTLTLTPPPLMAPSLEPDHQEPKKPRRTVLSFDLDLNLPAPEDDHREPKFPFATKQQRQQQQQQQQKQQQPPLVFSARTLVDCHN